MKILDGFDLTDLLENQTELMSLITDEDEDEDDIQIQDAEVPADLPILPVRNNVLYPGIVMPITLGRDKSVQLVKEAYKEKKSIGVVAQKDKSLQDPSLKDLYEYGTMAQILKIFKMPDGSTTVVLQGQCKVKILSQIKKTPYLRAKVKRCDDQPLSMDQKEFDVLVDSVKDLFLQVVKLSKRISTESTFTVQNINNPRFVLYFMASGLEVEAAIKQRILEAFELGERATTLLKVMTEEMQALELRHEIQHKVKTDLDKQQRDYILNQQLKTIQEELGGGSSEQDVEELKKKAETKKWEKEIAEVFQKELKKLQRSHPMAPDYGIQLNYLNILVELPWNEYSNDQFDLKTAAKVLDKDHFGLEKVKERVLEHLAVLKLRGDMKAPILCLYGPPGVGKTSLGKSIAEALGRNYVRVALGGLRDESEIRGHRKTYIGAMPGRIIQSLKKARTSNPVFMLDEIDKVLGMNINGDPSAALLEVLDPEQNTAFHDNFIEVDYDLSKVFFIATANSISQIHPALLDRMEIIEVSGYIVEEKMEIAKRHLIPRQLEAHGLKRKDLTFTDGALQQMIRHYTRESGVRQLEKQIAAVIRVKARSIVENSKKISVKIEENDLKKLLGVEKVNHEKALETNAIGVAAGLAWTSVGGEILFIEAGMSPGKGDLSMTGSLGEVMKESATLAYEYVKAHAPELGISQQTIDHYNIHLHVPEGATPKDGPSAGIAILSTMVSVFTERGVRADVAMTGEITLRGKVLPVGGLREKILAAKRANISQIVLSASNRPQIEEIPKTYIKGLKIHYVENMSEVLPLTLEKSKKKEKKKD